MAKASGTINLKNIKKAAGSAISYITSINNNGIFVHPENNNTDGVRITDAIEIIKNNVSYFKAYVESSIAKVRVGREDKGHSIIDSNGMRIYGGDGTALLANIGYGEGNGQDGTKIIDEYYTFGQRYGQIGACSLVEGGYNSASGWCSHAEGNNNVASGGYSHTEGGGMFGNTASGYASHVEGSNNKAIGDYSHVSGIGNTANYEAQTVIGRYAPSTTSDDLFVVGNGVFGRPLSYAMRLKEDGRVEFAGAVGSGLLWKSRSEMITIVKELSLTKPYVFFASYVTNESTGNPSYWGTTAEAEAANAFGIICKMSTTTWHMFFMCGGNIYKSTFTWDGGTTTTGTFNTKQLATV